MVLEQSTLTRFLYEARVPSEDALEEVIPVNVNGNSSNVVAELQPTPRLDDVEDSSGNNATKLAEPALSSSGDCIVLNAISTPIRTVDQVPDLQIVDPMVAMPFHAAARQWHRAYEHNHH